MMCGADGNFDTAKDLVGCQAVKGPGAPTIASAALLEGAGATVAGFAGSDVDNWMAKKMSYTSVNSGKKKRNRLVQFLKGQPSALKQPGGYCVVQGNSFPSASNKEICKATWGPQGGASKQVGQLIKVYFFSGVKGVWSFKSGQTYNWGWKAKIDGKKVKKAVGIAEFSKRVTRGSHVLELYGASGGAEVFDGPLLSLKHPGSDSFVPADSTTLKYKGVSADDAKCACISTPPVASKEQWASDEAPKIKQSLLEKGFFQRSNGSLTLAKGEKSTGLPERAASEAAAARAARFAAIPEGAQYLSGEKRKMKKKRPKMETPGFGSYCAVWGKTRPHGTMSSEKSWCWVDPACPDAKEDIGRSFAYCRSDGPAYTKEVNGKLPTQYGSSLEYKCWPGYTLDGQAAGRTKITSSVNSIGQFWPPVPAQCKMISYSICGWTRDARNGRGLGGITVQAGGKSTTSRSNGFYQLWGVPAGPVTLKVSGGNFIDVEKQFNLFKNTHCEGVGAVKMSPKMANHEWRAVLSWGRRPSDLDTHVYWGTRKTLWYRRGMNWGYGMGVALEKDDVSSYGPETIFFKKIGGCTSGSAIHCDITYKIKDYGRNGIIKSGSEASVILYHGDHVVGEFKVSDAPDSAISSDKNWWHVFTIDGKTNKLKWSSSPASSSFLQAAPHGHVTPMNGTGYDGLGPFPRRKWKRRSQRDPEIAKVRRALVQNRTTRHRVVQQIWNETTQAWKPLFVEAAHASTRKGSKAAQAVWTNGTKVVPHSASQTSTHKVSSGAPVTSSQKVSGPSLRKTSPKHHNTAAENQHQLRSYEPDLTP